jgi:hypothetical protein
MSDSVTGSPSRAGVDGPRKVRKDPSRDGALSGKPKLNVSFDLDFAKFFATTLLSAMFFLGFVYTNSFFKSFGLTTIDLEVGLIDVASRGLFLFQDVRVYALGLLILPVLALVITFRDRLGQFAYAAGTLAFLLVVFGSGLLGEALGREHARQITAGAAGKIAYCSLVSKPALNPAFVAAFERLTTEGNMRKIHQTDQFLYLSAVVEGANYVGASLAIPVSQVSHCRFIGT